MSLTTCELLTRARGIHLYPSPHLIFHRKKFEETLRLLRERLQEAPPYSALIKLNREIERLERLKKDYIEYWNNRNLYGPTGKKDLRGRGEFVTRPGFSCIAAEGRAG